MRAIRPVLVRLDGLVYELHLGGRPGRPRVYRRTDWGHRKLKDNDPLIPRIATQAMVDARNRRDAAAREMRRRASRWFRMRMRLGAWWARVRLRITRIWKR